MICCTRMIDVVADMAAGAPQSRASHWRRASAMASNSSGRGLGTAASYVGCPAFGPPLVGQPDIGGQKLGSPSIVGRVAGLGGSRAPDPMTAPELHHPVHPVRLVTAASLFDGHDAAINVMRRILQSQGAEVVHLGHNRSVDEVVRAAVQEDVQGVAVSSYQGGHIEYFRYLVDRLRAEGRPDVKVFGGGGGVIVQDEIDALHEYGVARIFSPADGQRMGLAPMVNTIISACDVDLAADVPT